MIPLVIDLDGTLIRGDLLQESALKLINKRPHLSLAFPGWLAMGKAQLKRKIADRISLDIERLPYNEVLLEWIRSERATGRHIVLCTASDAGYAQGVAHHLGVFDEVIASNGIDNVSAERKAAVLVERFGERGFDYAGNSRDDLAVWKRSRRAIVVNASRSVRAEAGRTADVEREIQYSESSMRNWIRAIRPHQWLKNLLILLPLAGAFQLDDLLLLKQALVAFVAFSLCASAVYVLNDLSDVESDRMHPRKKLRPFASGQLSPVSGVVGALVLLLASAALALSARPAFMACLAGYFVLTLAYTFVLKKRVLVDCIALGSLYTLRIVAGWSAVGLPASFWLLAFSLFLFLSLAFVKRYSELLVVARLGRNDIHGRGYLASDLPLVQSMGVAAGFSSVLILALYINGDTVLKLYSHPQGVWLTVPVLLYWISRMWMQAQRGHMHDDPVVFAIKDRYSLLCGVLFLLVLWVSR